MLFLHAADIHLDSPLRGLAQYEGAPAEAIREATRHALDNLVTLALERQVDFVLLAGDLYDGDRDDFNIVLFFNRQMLRLREAGIPVLMISGNHDADNRMTTRLNPPENVYRFGTDQPGTRVLEDVGAAVHGQGFATAAVKEDLSAAYPDAVRDCFNIGLLHTCGTGAEGHAPYAPCTFDGLRSRQYNYWALGHVHQRQDFCAEDPLAVFPGNIQGRHIRETGAKGCLLVHVDDDHTVSREFVPLDVFRWEQCRLDASQAESPEGVLDLFDAGLRQQLQSVEGRPLAVRVEVQGATEAHAALVSSPDQWVNEIRNQAMSLAGDQVWIEKVRLNTRLPAGGELLDSDDGPLGELHRLMGELNGNSAQLEELAAGLKPLRQKLAGVLTADELELLLPESPEELQQFVATAGEMLLGRLHGSRDDGGA